MSIEGEKGMLKGLYLCELGRPNDWSLKSCDQCPTNVAFLLVRLVTFQYFNSDIYLLKCKRKSLLFCASCGLYFVHVKSLKNPKRLLLILVSIIQQMIWSTHSHKRLLLFFVPGNYRLLCTYVLNLEEEIEKNVLFNQGASDLLTQLTLNAFSLSGSPLLSNLSSEPSSSSSSSSSSLFPTDELSSPIIDSSLVISDLLGL